MGVDDHGPLRLGSKRIVSVDTGTTRPAMASTALLSRSLAGDTDHWKTCIPKELGLPVEPPKDDEASILDTVRKSYLWKDNTPDLYVPTEVNLVDNKTLVKKYLAKKETMKAKGRSTGDCQDVYTFAIERLSNLTNICHDGPVSRPAKRHLLGDSRLGFRVWQHADVCLHIGARMNRNPLALVIYKVMLGRRKMLHLEHYTNVHNALKPTPGYDCHMSSTQASPMDVTQVAANLDQVYLYDCDGDTHTRRHVSHCLPYAVVIYARQFLPKPAPADSMMPRSSLLNDSHPSPRTNAQTKQCTLEGNSDEERCSSLSPEGTVAWGHTDFTVTHWRKLLSRRSIEELEDVSLTHGKSSENYISEIGSCDQLPNLVVKRVVTHGCPLSVKKAALQWKVHRINKLRPSRRNFSARPRLTHRLLSDRFSEICSNVKYKEAVLSETRKARMKTTLTQHNEILCQLSQSCRAPACLQGELRETEEQDTASVPVMANSGLHELADAEMVADSTCSPTPRKRKKIARDSGGEGNLWQSQVIKGSRLKVNFRRITSPTSKPSVTCSPNSTTSPSKKPSVTCSPNITTSPSRKPSVTCSPNSTTSSSRKLSVTCSPNSTTSSSRKLSVTCSPNNIMSSSRKPSVTCNPNRLVPYDGSNDECCHGDVEPCSIQTGVSSQVPVLVKQSSDLHESHDNKSVTVAPIQRRHSPVKCCFVDLGSPVRGESYTFTGVKPLCDGTHSGEYVDVQLQAQATGSDVHTDVKHVTKVPATSSDINPTVKVPTTGGDTHATVKHVTKVPATCGDTHAAVIKSVTKAAETGCEIHADVKKLAALMTLESYWSVAEALGTAKRTKTSQRQKSSDRNLEKPSGSKVPRRQSNSSECSKSSKKKSTSCYGVISSMKKTSRKHRKTHRKTSGESVRTSMEDGEVYAVSVSPASVVRPGHSHVSPRDTVSSTSGMAQVSDAVKPSVSGDVERLDSVHVCGMAGGCMHVAGVGVTWSINTEPVFSTREQPTFHKSIQSSASMMFMLDKPTTKVSGIEVKAVGKETKLDDTEVKLPENESNITEAEVKGFGKQVKLPENEVKLSNYSGEVELPVVGVKQCENVVKLHDTGMSPCNVPCAVYYTDICQSDSGTGDELPLSTHVPVTVHRETSVWQSQAIEGSSLKVGFGLITSPSSKTLFACSPNRLVAHDGSESIQLPLEWSSDHHGSRDSKSVANAPIHWGHFPVKQHSRLTADSYTLTGVNPLCDRTHSEECIDVKHVTEVAASDELSYRLAARMTPESYWSVAEAIGTATRTKSCQRQKTSDRNSEKSSGSMVLHGQSNRMASSKSPNKMKVSENGSESAWERSETA
ncbi:hypothetical protein LSAT2_004498 [Lamellibrachia satsuma]|nr:hypothetical protein LSAT2_004498 [Lamellibrachia satsuma]